MNDIQAQAGTPDPIADTVRALLQGAAVRVGPDVDRGQLHALIERLVNELRDANRIIDIERAAAERCAGESERDQRNAAKSQAEAAKLLDERDHLQKFKTFVHQRLDEIGIPPNPEGTHSKAGCRIGDRLDIVEQRIKHAALADGVLGKLIDTVEATGGLDADGNPVADPDWIDLGDVYADACCVVGKSIKHEGEEE